MVEIMFVLLVHIVVQTGFYHTCGEGHGRNKNKVNKDNLDEPDDGLQTN